MNGNSNLMKDITILDVLQVWNVLMNLQQSTNDEIMADNHKQNEILLKDITQILNEIIENQHKIMKHLGVNENE